MRIKNYWFSVLSLILAISYALLAFNMGPKDTHINNLYLMGIFYIPLCINSFRTFRYSEALAVEQVTWICLILLLISTFLMVYIGQNLVGVLLGMANFMLCVVMLGQISATKKNLTHHSSGTPNGAPYVKR